MQSKRDWPSLQTAGPLSKCFQQLYGTIIVQINGFASHHGAPAHMVNLADGAERLPCAEEGRWKDCSSLWFQKNLDLEWKTLDLSWPGLPPETTDCLKIFSHSTRLFVNRRSLRSLWKAFFSLSLFFLCDIHILSKKLKWKTFKTLGG